MSAGDDDRMVSEIRAILAAFDWEHDDRQYALERIEMIVADGQEDEPEDDHWREAYTCSSVRRPDRRVHRSRRRLAPLPR